MHIQYSYNSNVSILLVSLLSHASGSLRTTPFHLKKKAFILVCIIFHNHCDKELVQSSNQQNVHNHSFQYKPSPVIENVTACVVLNYPILSKKFTQSVCEDVYYV